MCVMTGVAVLVLGRLACTPGVACGYGTGVERSAVAAAGGGVHGFPAVLTSFIGRDEAVSVVAGLLGERRLVTVAGPGGSGKTRLAGVVAGRVADRFADGVWLAELAPVRDPALVPSVVAAALGIRDQPGGPGGSGAGAGAGSPAVAAGPGQLRARDRGGRRVVRRAAGRC